LLEETGEQKLLEVWPITAETNPSQQQATRRKESQQQQPGLGWAYQRLFYLPTCLLMAIDESEPADDDG